MAKAAVASSAPTPAKAAVATSAPTPLPIATQLSPFEIEAANDDRERLLTRLNNARQALQRREGELGEVCRREEAGKRFLEISTGVLGFESQRARARELLEHCANRKRELNPLIENRRNEVSDLQKKLSRVPDAALDQKELIELGRSLSAPLP